MRKEEVKERLYFILFIIFTLIFLAFIFLVIPIEKMQIFLLGLLATFILTCIFGLPIFFFMMWQNQKDYIKELKMMKEVNNVEQ